MVERDAAALAAKSPFTFRHSERVALVAVRIQR